MLRMSDVAIVTFHRACNYGAFLQAYALQETLNQYDGINAYIFDYRSETIEGRYKPDFYLRRDGKTAKTVLKFVVDFCNVQKRNRAFDNARARYYRYKNENVSKRKLHEQNSSYDALIVGSDQVWNRDIVIDDNTYFLDFVKSPVMKFSYAASIGKQELSDFEVQDIVSLTSDYSGISVREADIVPQLNRTGALPNVWCSLDPVFLFDAEKWRKFSEYTQRKPYVLFFMMGQSASAVPAMQFAKKLASERGLEVVYLSDNERWYKFRDLTHFGIASPAEFVGLIDNAEYVVTNSFHATAFSIILHKKFFVETEVLRNNRILNLLEVSGLQQCGLVKGKCEHGRENLDWDRVDINLAPSINDSKAYIDFMIDTVRGGHRK